MHQPLVFASCLLLRERFSTSQQVLAALADSAFAIG